METIKIMGGQFTPQEARENLMHLIKSNITYYTIKNWSSRERFGTPCEESEAKIKELDQVREHLLSTLKNSENEGKPVQVEWSVQLNVETANQLQAN